jgi:hypothetical protein
MGEYADMMIEGILCQLCGVFLEDYEDNICPTYCEDCAKEMAIERRKNIKRAKPKEQEK